MVWYKCCVISERFAFDEINAQTDYFRVQNTTQISHEKTFVIYSKNNLLIVLQPLQLQSNSIRINNLECVIVIIGIGRLRKDLVIWPNNSCYVYQGNIRVNIFKVWINVHYDGMANDKCNQFSLPNSDFIRFFTRFMRFFSLTLPIFCFYR